MNPDKKRIAIVTGASAGLGTDYARAVDRQFTLDEVWLVARRIEPMRKLAAELGRARGVPLSLDLGTDAGVAALAARLRAEEPDVVVLINNAGYGKIGQFSELDLSAQLGEIDLNVRALTAITHHALPYMRRNSYIMQVASSAGFAPTPNHAVYGATKAYVVSFSYALRAELRKRGISVTAVCPGPVATEFLDVALPPGAPRKITQTRIAARSQDVVDLSFFDLKAGRAISVYGWLMRVFILFSRVVPPSWLAGLIARRP